MIKGRAYYSSSINDFMNKNRNEIFGEITSNDQFAASDLQKNAWMQEIEIFKNELVDFSNGHLLFEYTIPRVGKRIDSVILYNGIVFLIEFKVGADKYHQRDIDQVTDYALDLNCFHKESDNKLLVPILVCTEAERKVQEASFLRDNAIIDTYLSNGKDIGEYIKTISKKYHRGEFDPNEWIDSIYMPTPTIIEAATALYEGHNVGDIKSNEAKDNLTITKHAINNIIDKSKKYRRKSICFVTGVPGAGKTLAGLDIAVGRQKADKGEQAVFLSGNGPLVDVLQEALSRDDHDRNKTKRTEAARKAREFIQIIHKFRDEAITVSSPPSEKVVIFDEAQRAWDEENLTNFMKQKKNNPNFKMSEPDFLISIMNRHKDWTTIVCLVGGGQEINKGESAGIGGWIEALRNKYTDWDIYLSDKVADEDYFKDKNFDEIIKGLNVKIIKELHLGVPIRSFRSEKVSDFVKALLDGNIEIAHKLYGQFKDVYPVCLTRDIEKAKEWVKKKAGGEKGNGTQRYGIVASSGARRLRKYGIWVQYKVTPPIWFLNDKNDVRSSYGLEETATEFDIQGLELDWAIVCWDANLRYNGKEFKHYNFSGTRWNNLKKDYKILYQKNAYRVLLTRARQGFIIFVPNGDDKDNTMLSSYYDGIYTYLKEIGLEEV